MMAFAKMLAYERIDISDGINVNKSYESKEGMFCHYWHFLDTGHIFVLDAIP